MNFAKFLRTPILRNISKRLPLFLWGRTALGWLFLAYIYYECVSVLMFSKFQSPSKENSSKMTRKKLRWKCLSYKIRSTLNFSKFLNLSSDVLLETLTVNSRVHLPKVSTKRCCSASVFIFLRGGGCNFPVETLNWTFIRCSYFDHNITFRACQSWVKYPSTRMG